MINLIELLSVGSIYQNISFYTLLVLIFLINLNGLDKHRPNKWTKGLQ